MSNARELLKKASEALEAGRDCAIDSLNEAEKMYSENYRPYKIENAKNNLKKIVEAIEEIEVELAKPEADTHYCLNDVKCVVGLILGDESGRIGNIVSPLVHSKVHGDNRFTVRHVDGKVFRVSVKMVEI